MTFFWNEIEFEIKSLAEIYFNYLYLIKLSYNKTYFSRDSNYNNIKKEH
jgi:hypothetical protein